MPVVGGFKENIFLFLLANTPFKLYFVLYIFYETPQSNLLVSTIIISNSQFNKEVLNKNITKLEKRKNYFSI